MYNNSKYDNLLLGIIGILGLALILDAIFNGKPPASKRISKIKENLDKGFEQDLNNLSNDRANIYSDFLKAKSKINLQHGQI